MLFDTSILELLPDRLLSVKNNWTLLLHEIDSEHKVKCRTILFSRVFFSAQSQVLCYLFLVIQDKCMHGLGMYFLKCVKHHPKVGIKLTSNHTDHYGIYLKQAAFETLNKVCL